MADLERFAVLAHDQHRVAAVVGRLGREASGEVVDRTAHNLGGAFLDPGSVEEVGEGNAGPHGVADEVAADRIGDARQGDGALDEIHVEDLVVGEFVGVVDHAGECKLPRSWVDLREREGGVDPVELIVGRGSDPTRQTRDVERFGADGAGRTVSERRCRRFRGCVGQHDLTTSEIAGTRAFGGATNAHAGERNRASTGGPAHECPTTVRWFERAGGDLSALRGDIGRCGS